MQIEPCTYAKLTYSLLNFPKQYLHNHLIDQDEEPGFFIFSSCYCSIQMIHLSTE